eukprot:767666-Hanusia_phi.AAC.1
MSAHGRAGTDEDSCEQVTHGGVYNIYRVTKLFRSSRSGLKHEEDCAKKQQEGSEEGDCA